MFKRFFISSDNKKDQAALEEPVVSAAAEEGAGNREENADNTGNADNTDNAENGDNIDASSAHSPSLWQKFSGALKNTSSKISGGVSDIFNKKTLDVTSLEQLEELLITSDVGIEVAMEICDQLAATKLHKHVTPAEILQFMQSHIERILAPCQQELRLKDNASRGSKPEIIVVAGVNGSGKTTTIGKLASKWQQQQKKVWIVACDTFRAAAVDQLEVWAKRSGAGFYKGALEEDPASVAFEGIKRATEQQADIVLIDTAGRLHNKTNLMQELQKIYRVIQKTDDTAPHHSLLVLDATTGQNAYQQVQVFADMVPLSGLIMTKLDGTAKGGVLVGIAHKHPLPIYAIGVGEAIEDLKPFDAALFAAAMFLDQRE